MEGCNWKSELGQNKGSPLPPRVRVVKKIRYCGFIDLELFGNFFRSKCSQCWEVQIRKGPPLHQACLLFSLSFIYLILDLCPFSPLVCLFASPSLFQLVSWVSLSTDSTVNFYSIYIFLTSQSITFTCCVLPFFVNSSIEKAHNHASLSPSLSLTLSLSFNSSHPRSSRPWILSLYLSVPTVNGFILRQRRSLLAFYFTFFHSTKFTWSLLLKTSPPVQQTSMHFDTCYSCRRLELPFQFTFHFVRPFLLVPRHILFSRFTPSPSLIIELPGSVCYS